MDIGAASCSVVEGVTQRYRTQDGRLDLDAAFDNAQVSALIGCSGLARGAVSPTLIVTGETLSGDDLTSVPVGDVGVDRLLIQAQ